MQHEIKDVTQCVKELTFKVPKETTQKDYEEIVRSFKQYVVVPGYRKGKAPLSMIARMFEGQIKETLINDKLPLYLKEILEKNDINPIAEPVLKKFDWEPGKELEAVVTYEITPQVDIKNYTGLKIPYMEVDQQEDQAESFINDQREKMVEFKAKEGGVVSEDSAISYELYDTPSKDENQESKADDSNKDENEQADDTKDYDHYIVSKKEFGDDFTNAVIGMSIGNTAMVKVPDEDGVYEEKTVKITKIYDVEYPELNDEFAKIFDYESMDKLREGIQKEFTAYIERERLKNKVMAINEALLENNPFDVPPTPVKQFAKNLAGDYGKRYKGSVEIDSMIEIFTPMAEQQMKTYLLHKDLLEKINPEPKKEDESKLLQEYAQQLQLSVDDLLKKDPDVTKKPEFVEKLKEKALYSYLIENNELYPKKPEPESEEEEAPGKGKEAEEKTQQKE